MKMTKRKTGTEGFTLIELMVVIGIIGIVSGIAIGGYLSWKPGNVFRSAVSQVHNDLMRAKMRAVENRRQCRVIFSTNGYQVEDGNRVMNSNNWGNLADDGTFTAGTPVRNEDFAHLPEITLLRGDGTVIVGPQPTVVFSPRGIAGADSVAVDHDDIGFARIAVSLTGRVNITWP